MPSTPSTPPPMPTESVDPAATQSAATPARKAALTVRLLEAMRPGDLIRDTEIGGFYAECGARGTVALNLAVDVKRGQTVRRTLAQWERGRFTQIHLRSLRVQAAALRADVRAGNVPTAGRGAGAAANPDALTVGTSVDRYIADMKKRDCAA